MLQVKKFNLKAVLNPIFLLIFSALIFSNLTDQYLQKQVEELISSKDGLSNIIWFWGFISILSAILFPLVISLLCAFLLVSNQQKVENKMSVFFAENIELSLIEILRSMGKVFLWSFLLIIPGVIKYIDYLLAPFVVMFSKRYKNGEVDALEYYTEISKKFWWSIKLWVVLFYVIIPIMIYALFDELRVFSEHPISATALTFVESVIELLFHFIILKLFIKFLNNFENNLKNKIEATNGAYV